MIEISLTSAIALYGAIILMGFAFLYLVSELRASRVYRVLEKQFLWRCSFCGFLYLDTEAATISQCPQCKSYNIMADGQDPVVSRQRQRFAAEETMQSTAEMHAFVPRRNSARRKRPGQRKRGPRRRR